mgnify:CR=1 FL=1
MVPAAGSEKPEPDSHGRWAGYPPEAWNPGCSDWIPASGGRACFSGQYCDVDGLPDPVFSMTDLLFLILGVIGLILGLILLWIANQQQARCNLPGGRVIYADTNSWGKVFVNSKYDAENIKVDVKGDDVYLIGPDKEKLGQTAANLKRITRIRKKDPRVFQDGVYLFKKQAGDKILWQIK